MIEALGGAGAVPLNLNAAAPVPILMVGLQGSGKTTTAGKLGAAPGASGTGGACCWRASTRSGRRRSCSWRSSPSRPGCRACRSSPARPRCEIARRAMETGRREGVRHRHPRHRRAPVDQPGADGRGAADPRRDQPGRDPAGGRCDDRPGRGEHRASAFNEAVGVTGIVMTRMDGDARGGAALSMRAITGAPIKLVGVGEKLDALEEFHPERVAGRILGMGDIVGLVEQRQPRRSTRRRRRSSPRKMMQGQVRPGGLRRPASPDHQDGQPVRHPRDAAGGRQDQGRRSRTPISTPAILKRQAAIICSMTPQGARAARTSSRRAARSGSPPAPAPRCRR